MTIQNEMIDKYIKESRKILSSISDEYFTIISQQYYLSFPDIPQQYLPIIKACKSTKMIPEIVMLDNVWYFIMDMSIMDFINKITAILFYNKYCDLTYLFFELNLFRSINLALDDKVCELSEICKHYRLEIANKKIYTDEIENRSVLVHNISYRFICMHENLHRFFRNRLHGDEDEFYLKSLNISINSVIERLKNKDYSFINPKTNEDYELHAVKLLLENEYLFEELFCDIKAVYLLLYTHSEIQQVYTPKIIIESIIISIRSLSIANLFLLDNSFELQIQTTIRLQVILTFLEHLSHRDFLHMPLTIPINSVWDCQAIMFKFDYLVESELEKFI